MARIEWNVQLPFEVYAEAVDSDTVLEVHGGEGWNEYTLRLIQKHQVTFLSGTPGKQERKIWGCERIMITTAHPDDTIRDLQGHDVMSGELGDGCLSIVSTFLRGVRYLSHQLQVSPLPRLYFLRTGDLRVTLDDGTVPIPSKWYAMPSFRIREENSVEADRVMEAGVESDFALETLYDAHAAYEAADVRRTVIDTAIALEILIKRHITKSGGDVFHLITEEHVLDFAVVDFYDKVLRTLDGRSLKIERRSDYNAICRLFQTRNKIVHTGRCGYTNNGRWHNVGLADARVFLDAASAIFAWLCGVVVQEDRGYVVFPRPNR